ncbi:hypothetical protein [Mycolicibacterium goodii]|uniref:hypothetical protein n=1 Tax=Mycolicibacterium goodii TaxID=134601 RepID=UPI00296F98A2
MYQGVSNAVGVIGQRTGHDAAMLSAGLEFVCVVLGCRFVEPQADTEVDQGAATLPSRLMPPSRRL